MKLLRDVVKKRSAPRVNRNLSFEEILSAQGYMPTVPLTHEDADQLNQYRDIIMNRQYRDIIMGRHTIDIPVQHSELIASNMRDELDRLERLRMRACYETT